MIIEKSSLISGIRRSKQIEVTLPFHDPRIYEWKPQERGEDRVLIRQISVYTHSIRYLFQRRHRISIMKLI